MVVHRPLIGVRNSLYLTSPSSYLRAKIGGTIWPLGGKPLPYSPHRNVSLNWLLEAALHSHPKKA
jgi:hypothetical protein